MVLHSFLCTFLLVFLLNTGQALAARVRPSYLDTSAYNYKPARTVVQCYSCMSTLYENLWYESGLSMLYKKPETFTVYCDREQFDSRKVMVKPCADYCVTIENENVIFSIVRKSYMRGCLSDLINYNVTTVNYLTNRQKCLTVPMRYLFMGAFGGVQNQPLRVCVCFEGLCNGATSVQQSRIMNYIAIIAFATYWMGLRQ